MQTVPQVPRIRSSHCFLSLWRKEPVEFRKVKLTSHSQNGQVQNPVCTSRYQEPTEVVIPHEFVVILRAWHEGNPRHRAVE